MDLGRGSRWHVHIRAEEGVVMGVPYRLGAGVVVLSVAVGVEDDVVVVHGVGGGDHITRCAPLAAQLRGVCDDVTEVLDVADFELIFAVYVEVVVVEVIDGAV